MLYILYDIIQMVLSRGFLRGFLPSPPRVPCKRSPSVSFSPVIFITTEHRFFICVLCVCVMFLYVCIENAIYVWVQFVYYANMCACLCMCLYMCVNSGWHSSRDTLTVPKKTVSPWVLGLADFARLGGHQAPRALLSCSGFPSAFRCPDHPWVLAI